MPISATSNSAIARPIPVYVVEQVDHGLPLVGGTASADLRVEARDRLVQAVDLREQLGQEEAVVRLKPAPERLLALGALLALRALGELGEHGHVFLAVEERG
jgi:hypothetical protein